MVRLELTALPLPPTPSTTVLWLMLTSPLWAVCWFTLAMPTVLRLEMLVLELLLERMLL
jgi:hypothetical protein